MNTVDWLQSETEVEKNQLRRNREKMRSLTILC